MGYPFVILALGGKINFVFLTPGDLLAGAIAKILWSAFELIVGMTVSF